jgi:hypothetical protein
MKEIQLFLDLGFATHTLTAYLVEDDEYVLYVFENIIYFADAEKIENGLYQEKSFDVEVGKITTKPVDEKAHLEQILRKLKQTTLLEYITSEKYDRCLDHNFNL